MSKKPDFSEKVPDRNLSEHEISEEVLRTNMKSFSILFSKASLPAVLMRIPDNVFIEVNDAYATMFGYSKEELIGKSASELGIDRNRGIIFDNEKTSCLNNYKQKLFSKTGVAFEVLLNTDFIKTDDGHSYALTTIQDITEKVHLEEELKGSLIRFYQILSGIKNAFTLISDKNKVELVNQAFCDMFGFTGSPNELINLSSEEMIRKVMNSFKNPEAAVERINDIVKAGQQVIGEEIRMANGKFYNRDFIPIYIGKERYGRLWLYNDITELKHTEAALRLSQEKLRLALRNSLEANEKLDLALEYGNIGVWYWNIKTDEVFIDERMGKMFGLQSGSSGRTYKDFNDLVNKEDMAHIRNSIRNTLEKDQPFETIFRIKAGERRVKYISSKAFVTKNAEGKPLTITGVCYDITELKKGTETLVSKLNEELLRSNKELQSFAYIASHDLQEPLRMVTSFTQLLAMQYKDSLDNKAMEYIDFAVNGAKRMYNLLNDLLAYSRIQTEGKEFARIDLNNILVNVIGDLSLIIEERKAVIQIDKLPIISADSSQMIILFQNLISNSIKFSKGSPRIYISCRSEADQYIFSVKDDGIGIEAQYFERIFHIFQRLLPKDNYEGTGIGLALCKRIVECHGGRIWVESTPGKGSTFFFTIAKGGHGVF